MKKIFLCAALAAMMMLSGCMGLQSQRGLDASGAFVSNAPVVSVQPAEAYSSVATGYTLCRVAVEDSMPAGVTAQVWYSLYKAEGSQLAVVMADCPSGFEWNISSVGVEYQAKPLLYKFYGELPNDATVLAYTRLVEKDPWMPFFVQAGSGWEGNTLVARYEWMSGSTSSKLIAEYREPAPEGLTIGSDVMNGFIQRSQKAFVLAGVQEPVQLTALPTSALPADWSLSPVIGSVSIPATQEDWND